MLIRHQRSPKNQTLNRVYPEWTDNKGVISSLSTAPWALSVSQQGLDLAYHGVRSGGKFVSPILYNFLDDDGEITTAGYSAIATMLMAKYGAKWSHLWDLYNSQYNPLDSYKITETESRSVDRDISLRDSGTVSATTNYDIDETDETVVDSTRAPHTTETLTLNTRTEQDNSEITTPTTTETVAKTSSNTKTPNTTETTTVEEDVSVTGSDDSETTYGKVVETESSATNESTDSRWGFNSQSASPADKSEGEVSTTKTETSSGSDAVERDTSETTDRDATTTVRKTGTESDAGEETTLTSYTGFDTVAEDKVEMKTGTETRAMAGTEDYDSTETTNRTGDNTTTSSQTTNMVHTTTDDVSEELERTKTGNLFKSPAELLSIDRDFWLMDFFEIVFMDIDSMLTLPIYSESEIRQYIF